MARFEITSEGIEAGYDDEGFFAFGTSTNHRFNDEPDWRFTTPSCAGLPVTWRLALTERDVFTHYAETTAWKPELRDDRFQLLVEFFAASDEQPAGMLHRWSSEHPIALTYHLPNDPALVAFIMGVVATKRQLAIYGDGWMFSRNDEPSAAGSVKGFFDRQEPAFTRERPFLRMM